MRIFSDQAGGVRRPSAASTVGKEGKRGMALLLVLTSIAVLTAVAVEFSYDTRIDSTLAAHGRDELRAYYMARSATNLSRLLLHFQGQIDRQGAQLGQLMGGGAAPKIRLWEALPIESSAINLFVGSISGPPPEDIPQAPLAPRPGEAVAAAGLQSFGSYEGGFSAGITDEEAKINLNKLNNPGLRGTIAAQQLMLVWDDPRWDFLFDEETSHRERYTREELLLHIRDWIDEDESGSALDRISGEIVPSASDEAGRYTRYRPTYEPKNALFDTLDEVFLVAGVGDRLMAAFSDRLTVYPDINSKLNINTNDPMQQYINILAAAEQPDNPLLQNPQTLQLVLDQIEMARMFGPFMGLTVQQFVGILEGVGITVRPEIKHNPNANDFLGDQSQTFRIEAVGEVGDVTKKLTTVIRYDEGLGKLLYYRED
jgi:general secretion pathway protein K